MEFMNSDGIDRDREMETTLGPSEDATLDCTFTTGLELVGICEDRTMTEEIYKQFLMSLLRNPLHRTLMASTDWCSLHLAKEAVYTTSIAFWNWLLDSDSDITGLKGEARRRMGLMEFVDGGFPGMADFECILEAEEPWYTDVQHDTAVMTFAWLFEAGIAPGSVVGGEHDLVASSSQNGFG